MPSHTLMSMLVIISYWACAAFGAAAEIRAAPDEPLAETFSLERAAQSLDTAAVTFTSRHRCLQCHVTMFYLAARPALATLVPTPSEVRSFCQSLAEARAKEPSEAYAGQTDQTRPAADRAAQKATTEAIAVAFQLAYYDRVTTGKLESSTRKALARLISLQRPDGGLDVIAGGVSTLLNEYDQTMLAAMAVACAPEQYSERQEAQAFLARIRQYVRNHKPGAAYHHAMLLWAASYLPGLVDDAQRAETAALLLGLQREDGGWSVAELLADNEKVRTGKFAKGRPSDGYGTGLALLALRNAGLASDDPRLRRGVAWLKSNQRASGRWFLPSFSDRSDNLISNAATAFALLGLEACGEIPQRRQKN